MSTAAARLPNPGGGFDLNAVISAARRSQQEWAAAPLRQRLAVIRRLRHILAARGSDLAAAAARASSAETLAAEILPLAEACRFLERRAESVLAPRRLGGRGRPAWLSGVALEIHREPVGLVLVISPSNYPLFLPGVQVVQALAAGNAVLLKPAPEGAAAARGLLAALVDAGLDPALLRLLPTDPESAAAAIRAGVDRVLLTGSADTGRRVLANLAPRLTPATMELSGCDAAFVREDADVDLAAASLAFGLRLNGGATCIAPRRAFVEGELLPALETRLAERVAGLPAATVPPQISARARDLAQAAIAGGARLLAGDLTPGAPFTPLILTAVDPAAELLRHDLFAPVLALVPVAGDEEALGAAADCPYALGATIFGADLQAARRLARRARAGLVIINDMIVPSADPRLPFSARAESGFGVTRGAEGLLELTAIKAVARRRRGAPLPHLEEPAPGDEELFASYLGLVHGHGPRQRWKAGLRLVRALTDRARRLPAR